MQNTTDYSIAYITENLNQEQHEAVTAPATNLLILAGAGSGKTRVLVHRIAWLIRTQQVSPHAILAVTFTNKAAKEMQHRVEQLLGVSTRSLWIGTFHGLAHRLLRIHWQLANLPQTFQILDSDDQLRIIKRITKDLNIDDNQFPAKQTQYYINNKKDDGLRYSDVLLARDRNEKYLQEIYRIYEQQCQQLGLVDFSEILLRAKELFTNNPELVEHYRSRFKHVLVDEFQDTNSLQYQWLKLMYNQNNNYFTMVGDDDQSIYSWRGAKVENIQKFMDDYPDNKVIRLQQNYRSTANILNTANQLISKNSNRLGKNLWTAGSNGDLVGVYQAFNDIDEAHYVISQVKNQHRTGINFSDMAVLYRANHQSRQFEETLIKAQIPYKIYGGQRFFERAEIKDALAYLRLVANPLDDTAFDRIINWPVRGIGKQSLLLIREYATANNLSLWQSLEGALQEKILKNKAASSLSEFMNLIKSLSTLSQTESLSSLVKMVINNSGLRDYYFKEEKSKDKTRVENLDELINASVNFEQEFIAQLGSLENTEFSVLHSFLAHAVLESGDTQAKEHEDSLNLMTIHAAKGLEFKVVFMVGLEEKLFPHEMCLQDPKQLSEERRLCYVGITRAMVKLYLTFAEVRRLRGEDHYNIPSRFIKEMPAELLQYERATTRIDDGFTKQHSYRSNTNNYYKNTSIKTAINKTTFNNHGLKHVEATDLGYNLGHLVKHSTFGIGTVLNIEGSGDKARVQVKFGNPYGVKWLIAKIAKLETVT